MADATTPDGTKRAKALQTSYAKATAYIIDKHKEEFDAHRAELLHAEGFEWSPPKTQEQKDADLLAEIRERSPSLFPPDSGALTMPPDLPDVARV